MSKQAAGKPYVAYSIGSQLTAPDNFAGINAAVKAINTGGGVNGRPLKVVTCNDENLASAASTCARTAISDSSVLAFVDTSSTYGTTYDPLLAKADMANIDESPYTTADFTSPVSFSMNGGDFNPVTGAYGAVKLLHEKRVGVPYVGTPAGAGLPSFIQPFIKPVGGVIVGAEGIPITATDLTSYAAAEVAAKPDVIADGLTNTLYENLIKAISSQGGHPVYEISEGVFDAGQVKKDIGNSPTVLLEEEFNHTAPGYQSFLHDMSTYEGSYMDHNDSALSGWTAVHAFAQALQGLAAEGNSNPTRADIVNYLNKQTDFDVQGLTGGLDFAKPITLESGSLARVFTAREWLAYAKDGKEQPINGGKAVNLPGWPTG